ncbi:uncharacterized protein LOC119283427 [Triticum dicoccoides]|uniref:uncharacterized protein LOC119283427 n=1 Tax=Triticum dicoccoides TaxID=85692 RepID=UPI00188E84CD|nr:uncharacterized protein LOC119283427 [Triticum dicoccoides]
MLDVRRLYRTFTGNAEHFWFPSPLSARALSPRGLDGGGAGRLQDSFFFGWRLAWCCRSQPFLHCTMDTHAYTSAPEEEQEASRKLRLHVSEIEAVQKQNQTA